MIVVSPKKRNVLILSIDCLGMDKYLRFRENHLPFFRFLESKGTLFLNAFATSSSTTPSMASALTGMLPPQHGVRCTRGYSLDARVSTLAQFYKDEGLVTRAFVSGPLLPETGLNRGFDDYHHAAPHATLKIARWTLRRSRLNKNEKDLFAWLRRGEGEARRFEWIHLVDLHNRWKGGRLLRRRKPSFEQSLAGIDRKVKRILERVDLENTSLVILADHGHYVREIDGEGWGTSLNEGHGYGVLDLLVRVPVLFVCPGIVPEGRTVEDIVQTTDIMRTLLEQESVDVKEAIHGKRLTPLLEQGSDAMRPVRRYVYVSACGSILKGTRNHFHGVRGERWKYVEGMGPASTRDAELYDLENDPDERRNVIEERREIAHEMKDGLHRICFGKD